MPPELCIVLKKQPQSNFIVMFDCPVSCRTIPDQCTFLLGLKILRQMKHDFASNCMTFTSF